MINEASAALDITARLAAFASIIASFETLAVRGEFRPGGVFSIANVSSLHPNLGVVDRSSDKGIVSGLTLAIAGYAGLLTLGPYSALGAVGLTLALGCRFFIWRRRILGGDGAEQLTTITLVATWLAVVPVPGGVRTDLAVAFIGAQLVLSYLTAGLAKVRSSIWRHGEALPGIFETETYGHAVATAFLTRSSRVATLLGWAVVAFECVFPILLVGPLPIAIAGFAIGLLFHIGCAGLMGLNSFLWAFPATYPCALVLGQWLSPFPAP